MTPGDGHGLCMNDIVFIKKGYILMQLVHRSSKLLPVGFYFNFKRKVLTVIGILFGLFFVTIFQRNPCIKHDQFCNFINFC